MIKVVPGETFDRSSNESGGLWTFKQDRGSSRRRRRGLANLQLYNVDAERKTLMVRQGKGKNDRLIPIGKRALEWIDRYLREARPLLLIDTKEQTPFLSTLGQPLEPDSLTEYVRRYVDTADVSKKGSCQMFRHTMATLMLENGADIRYIQAMTKYGSRIRTIVHRRMRRSVKRLPVKKAVICFTEVKGMSYPSILERRCPWIGTNVECVTGTQQRDRILTPQTSR